MKNYPTKIGKLYLTTYVLNILYPYIDGSKNKEYGTEAAFFSQNISVKHSLNIFNSGHLAVTFALLLALKFIDSNFLNHSKYIIFSDSFATSLKKLNN